MFIFMNYIDFSENNNSLHGILKKTHEKSY